MLIFIFCTPLSLSIFQKWLMPKLLTTFRRHHLDVRQKTLENGSELTETSFFILSNQIWQSGWGERSEAMVRSWTLLGPLTR